MKNGYAILTVNGVPNIVSRMACEAVNGPPPSGRQEAAHSCGNGRMGCVNPNHLSWRTPVENASDKEAHGTNLKGEMLRQSKLTEEDVLSIRELSGQLPHRVIAAAFSISHSQVGRIIRRLDWRHI